MDACKIQWIHSLDERMHASLNGYMQNQWMQHDTVFYFSTAQVDRTSHQTVAAPSKVRPSSDYNRKQSVPVCIVRPVPRRSSTDDGLQTSHPTNTPNSLPHIHHSDLFSPSSRQASKSFWCMEMLLEREQLIAPMIERVGASTGTNEGASRNKLPPVVISGQSTKSPPVFPQDSPQEVRHLMHNEEHPRSSSLDSCPAIFKPHSHDLSFNRKERQRANSLESHLIVVRPRLPLSKSEEQQRKKINSHKPHPSSSDEEQQPQSNSLVPRPHPFSNKEKSRRRVESHKPHPLSSEEELPRQRKNSLESRPVILNPLPYNVPKQQRKQIISLQHLPPVRKAMSFDSGYPKNKAPTMTPYEDVHTI